MVLDLRNTFKVCFDEVIIPFPWTAFKNFAAWTFCDIFLFFTPNSLIPDFLTSCHIILASNSRDSGVGIVLELHFFEGASTNSLVIILI